MGCKADLWMVRYVVRVRVSVSGERGRGATVE